MPEPNNYDDLNYQLDIPLYRMSNEVKTEVAKALNFWNMSSGSKDPILTALIIRELSNPYTTTLKVAENGGSANSSEPSTNSRVQNGVVAFKKQLETYYNNSTTPEMKKILGDLISTFEIAIESVL